LKAEERKLAVEAALRLENFNLRITMLNMEFEKLNGLKNELIVTESKRLDCLSEDGWSLDERTATFVRTVSNDGIRLNTNSKEMVV